MSDTTNILLGILLLIIGVPIGSFLAKATKDELNYGQIWFKLITILSLLGGFVGLLIKNDFIMFSFFFIAIVTSRSIIGSLTKFKNKSK